MSREPSRKDETEAVGLTPGSSETIRLSPTQEVNKTSAMAM
jgi:hypothetical protein